MFLFRVVQTIRFLKTIHSDVIAKRDPFNDQIRGKGKNFQQSLNSGKTC